MYYITNDLYDLFSKNINVVDSWNALSDQEKLNYISYAESIIDNLDYVGEELQSIHAFPRDFTNLITTNISAFDKKVLTYSNLEIPESIRLACYFLVEQLLKEDDFKEIKNMRDTLELTRVDTNNLVFEFSGNKFSINSISRKHLANFLSSFFSVRNIM